MRSIHYALESVFALQNKRLEFRSLAESSDFSIRSTRVPGPTATIVSPSGNKNPPIELLIAYDEIIFQGETNGQLPTFLQHAFEKRGKVPWKRLDILSIDDLTGAARPGVPLLTLEGERHSAEEYFKQHAAVLGQNLFLYRYGYRGTYGSMWKRADRRRRVHASSRIAGMNIRQSPSQDYIDFADNKHPMVDVYFKIAHDAIEAEGTRCIFSHGEE